MSFTILVETDGQVGGIGELNEMGISIKQLENDRNDFPQVFGGAIEGDHKSIVGEWRFDNFVQRFFGGDVLLLLQDNTSNGFGVGENWFPTFGVISVFKFQGTEDLCYHSFEVVEDC